MTLRPMARRALTAGSLLAWLASAVPDAVGLGFGRIHGY
jgi:hypothetical protein